MPAVRASATSRASAYMPADSVKILDEAVAQVIAGWLRPYQLDWVADRSRYKAGNMARQTGKSKGCMSLEAVLTSLEPKRAPEHVEIMVSASQRQADELLRKAVEWTDLIDAVTRKVAGFSIYAGEGPTKTEIPIFNGKRIVSLPANPRTIVGYTGDWWWDETSKTQRDELVAEALFGIVASNKHFRARIGSTPWGDSGIFYEVMEGKGQWGRAKWSRHTADIMRAIADGAGHNIDELRDLYPPHVFDQEYMCQFLSGENQLFNKEILAACQALRLPDYMNVDGTDKRGVRRSLGIDVGRTNDLTALIWTVEYPNGMCRVERVRAYHRMRFAEQQDRIERVLAHGRGANNKGDEDVIGYVHTCTIDSTGLGMQMAEYLQESFPAVVKCLPFTTQSKLNLINDMYAAADTGHLQLDVEVDGMQDLLTDLGAIRRHLLPGGGTRYDAKRVTLDDGTTAQVGHADRAIGLALSLVGLLGSNGDWGLEDGLDDGDADAALAGAAIEDDGKPSRRRFGEGILGHLAKRVKREPGVPIADDLGGTNYDEEDLREMRRMIEDPDYDDEEDLQ